MGSKLRIIPQTYYQKFAKISPLAWDEEITSLISTARKKQRSAYYKKDSNSWKNYKQACYTRSFVLIFLQ